MLSYEGIPLRRIERISDGRYLIERIDRSGFCVPLASIGTDEGVEEAINTARKYPGQILESTAELATDYEESCDAR